MPAAALRYEDKTIPEWRGSAKFRRAHTAAQDSAVWSRDDIPPRLMGQPPQNDAQNKDRFSKLNASSSKSQHQPHPIPDSHSKSQANNPERKSPWQRRASSSNVVAPRKRKATPGNEEQPARRKKLESPKGRKETIVEGLKDADYYLRNLLLPTRHDYAGLPENVLLKYPKRILHNAAQGVVKLHSSFSALKLYYKCQVVSVMTGREPINGFGEGLTKKDAEHAAYLHLVSKMHEVGLIRELFGQSIDKLDNKTIKEERDAKLDIYNYAARYGCVPRITLQKLASPTTGLRRRGHKTRRQVVEITVELTEQKIKVVARGENLVTAEIAASIKFKQEAEKYHAEQGTDSLIVKDSTSLNVDNARNFFEWYKINDPRAQIELKSTTSIEYQSFGGSSIETQVIFNGNPLGTPVLMSTKKKSEDLAYLTAAVECTKQDETFLPRYLKALHLGNGNILRPMGPIDMPVDDDCILLMRDTLLNARRLGLKDEQEELQSEDYVAETRRGKYRPALGQAEAEMRSVQLERAYREYTERPDLAKLRQKREELPMNQYRARVLDIVNSNTYSIIIGATGSGKTTQVPQILLEHAIGNQNAAACNIICTQPRRIAATSVAKRVADERAEKLQSTVGYHVRFDAKLPQVGGSITYCTTGILLQQLQHSPDEVLNGTSHLIIDEVHERDMQIDFLLIILRKVVALRIRDGKSVPKVVLMSATMDADLFASYFKNTALGKETSGCPTLSVPGRTFPVKEQHLEHILSTLDKEYGMSQLQAMYNDMPTTGYFQAEKSFAKENPLRNRIRSTTPEGEEEESIIDWKRARVMSSGGEAVVSNEKDDALVPVGLVATTIAHIAKTTKDGAILVFLPGIDEMVKVDELLRNGDVLGVNFRDESKYKLYLLHSSIAAGQNEVFDTVPEGCRKIILGTNIAETSITIPDVQYVVDTGKLREKQYDQSRRITKLQCTWISKSNSKQRAGRAGRVQNGHYYALFSQERYEALRAIGVPELLRADLQETCLDIKAQAFKAPIREFLAEAIEPPAPNAVNTAVLNLQALGALTDTERLTPLGRLLSSLPVHPALGKMIVLGVVFRCLDPMLLLGAATEERQLFMSPLSRRDEAQAVKESFVQGSGSDHIAFLHAFHEMRSKLESRGQAAMWEFSSRNFLHQGAFKAIDATARQIEEVLVEAKLIPYTPRQARHNYEYGDPLLNENSSKVHIIKALAFAGLHPNLAVAAGSRTLRTSGEKGTLVHPASVNALKHDKDRDGHKYGSLLTYTTMAKSNDGNTIFLRDTSEITPLMASLFGGRLHADNLHGRILQIDEWLSFYVKAEDGRALKTIIEFRKALERLLAGTFADLSRKRFLAENPLRECFAEGLVEVLGRDVRPAAKTLGRGWGRTTGFMRTPTVERQRGRTAGDRWSWDGAT